MKCKNAIVIFSSVSLRTCIYLTVETIVHVTYFDVLYSDHCFVRNWRKPLYTIGIFLYYPKIFLFTCVSENNCEVDI